MDASTYHPAADEHRPEPATDDSVEAETTPVFRRHHPHAARRLNLIAQAAHRTATTPPIKAR